MPYWVTGRGRTCNVETVQSQSTIETALNPHVYQAMREGRPDGYNIWSSFPRVSKNYQHPPPLAQQEQSSSSKQPAPRNSILLAMRSDSQDSHNDMFFPLPPSSRTSESPFVSRLEEIDNEPSLEWRPLSSRGQPPSDGICAHTTTRVGNALYLIGGSDANGCLNIVRRLDLTTLEWTKIDAKMKEPLRKESGPKLRAHTATRVHDSIVVYGGGNGPRCELLRE